MVPFAPDRRAGGLGTLAILPIRPCGRCADLGLTNLLRAGTGIWKLLRHYGKNRLHNQSLMLGNILIYMHLQFLLDSFGALCPLAQRLYTGSGQEACWCDGHLAAAAGVDCNETVISLASSKCS